jgi:hypothetical protein
MKESTHLLRHPFRRALAFWLGIAALPFLFSCAGTTMREHFADYNTAYADALNHQMLLNLARLENGHPAYFLAIGAIDDRLTVSETGSAGHTGSFTDNNTVTHSQSGGGVISRTRNAVLNTVFGYNINGSATRSSSPEFNFIPLNNDAVAKQILQPIGPEVFYTLYQQGYPIDQLMRVMIERVETTLPNMQQVVLVNSPKGGPSDSFARFLRACAILRQLQLNGYLSLRGTNQQPEKLGPVFFSGGAKPGGASGPTIKDYADATDKGWVLMQTNEDWQIGKLRETPVFTLNTDAFVTAQSALPLDPLVAQAVSNTLARSEGTLAQRALLPIIAQGLANSEFSRTNTDAIIADDVLAAATVISLLSDGISVQTKVSGEAQARTRLVLRSYGRAMEAVAAEQPAFDALAKSSRQFRFIVPDMERHPVIRIDWSAQKDHLVPALQTLHYAGKTYQVTDPIANPLNPNATWNRDVFRLMVALSSQVTVDISKFQQKVFELRTD